MSEKSCTAEQIDALLPQTQCGLCHYKGCMPYATALANNEAEINLCPPGGVEGLLALADILKKDPTPFIDEMKQKEKPYRVAVIREAECIGCTKCIQACPVDAILGTNKQMHTVIMDECTGCELCIAPCPVDCIDMVIPTQESLFKDKTERANHYRNRYLAREKRLQEKPVARVVEKSAETLDAKKAYIDAAMIRFNNKKK